MTGPLADLQITAASKQYVRVPVRDLTGADPTVDAVAMAFPEPGTEPTTFYTGSWVTIRGAYNALCLVGTGGAVALTPGFYDVYVKITDNPEVPVLRSGLMEVI